MNVEEKEKVVANAKAAIFAELVVAILFNNIMNRLLGSIIVFQILAHMPLADIILPANAFEKFEIMVDVVSFDFFAVTEYIDIGLTETEPWSQNFEFLKYETVNFIEGMGSILPVGLITLVIAFASFTMTVVKRKIFCKGLQPNVVTLGLVTFMTGTFFENLVCISISMQMLTYYEVLNSADKMSIAFQFLFLAAVVAFIAYVTYFAIIVSPKLVARTKGMQLSSKQEKISLIHKRFMFTSRRSLSLKGMHS